MAAGLTVRYDPVGDILYIDTVPPYSEQESDEIDDEIVGRMSPTSGAIENLEALFFSKRALDGTPLVLPILARLEPMK